MAYSINGRETLLTSTEAVIEGDGRCQSVLGPSFRTPQVKLIIRRATDEARRRHVVKARRAARGGARRSVCII